MYVINNNFNNKEEMYKNLVKDLKMIVDKNYYFVTNLSNASALINMYLKNINWVGFYLYKDGFLHLGPFNGKVACTTIKDGNGVCGSASYFKKTIRVDNVLEFDGHIACDSASLSEIVVPIFKEDNTLFGVLDIDSYVLNNFDETDELYLNEICNILKEYINKSFI